ncbi:hypothetical protein ABH940_005445 [Streptacidiphilus sp. BW17]|uniref:WhiB family transcriptional regulator n=1 Tax=Streptacidiphilus sp. BW17 TaxID=3156274 RepID=UPI00351720CF
MPVPTPIDEPGSQYWRFDAACRAHSDPDLFFPKPRQHRQTAKAKRICGTCPVVAECLESALRNGDEYGIRAGLTEQEREAQHQRRLYEPHQRPPANRLSYQRVLLAARGEEIELSDREADLLCAFADADEIPWRTWSVSLGITSKSGAWKRKVRARVDPADPEVGPQRQQELADLIVLADLQAPRRVGQQAAA